MSIQPPKRALKFLRWFCRPDYLDEIEGDLIELFEKRHESSPKKAQRSFIWDVLKSFRLRNIKTTATHSNSIGMYKNYIKIAFRVFKREKSFTLINVLGLASGLAITLLIIQYARFEFSYESMHGNSDRIVRLTMDYIDGETISGQDCETYPPVGPRMLAELPEVENFVRAYDKNESTVQIGEQFYVLDKLLAVDSSFFSMFNYPLIYGSRAHIFEQPRQAVLTESTAIKYFNRTDIVGEVVRMPLDNKTISYKVVGVVRDSPPNTHLKFDMLISYPTMTAEFGETDDNWNGNNTYTYVQLAPGIPFEEFSNKLISFNQQLIDEEKLENERIVGQKIADIHLYSNKPFEPEPNGDATAVFFLLGVAFLVIVSAFVNYVNLATSKALDRAKEVGIRKVVGSSINQLRTQFLVESTLVNVFAAGCALLLIFISKEYFVEISGLPTVFSIFDDLVFWELVGGFTVLGVILSGLYPAFLLSSFKPVAVLKGKFSNSSKGVFLRKSLVVFQFSITIILLVQTFTVHEQLSYMREMDLGVDVSQTIVVKAPVQDTVRRNYSVFKQQLLERSIIKEVSLSETVPGLPRGEMNTTTGINLTDAIEEHYYNFYLYRIDQDFIPLIGMEMLAGKNFDENSNWDKRELIVNEEALRLWGVPEVEAAIGEKLSFWGEQWTIIGVIKDYHQESAKEAHIPILHFYSTGFDSYASIKFSNGDPRSQLAEIQHVYEANFPNAPFEYFFLDREYDKQFKADERFQDVFSVLTGFAILIACLGLFGLASFTVAKRTKEIGIRKVIGASASQIMVLLSKDFVKTVLIAVLIGLPVTYLAINSWLENFASRIEMSWWLFAIPSVSVLFLAIAAMSFKTIRVALSNPVDSLKDE